MQSFKQQNHTNTVRIYIQLMKVLVKMIIIIIIIRDKIIRAPLNILLPHTIGFKLFWKQK